MLPDTGAAPWQMWAEYSDVYCLFTVPLYKVLDDAVWGLRVPGIPCNPSLSPAPSVRPGCLLNKHPFFFEATRPSFPEA